MDSLNGYHDCNRIAKKVRTFLLYVHKLIVDLDKECTLPELVLSVDDIQERIDAINSISHSVLPCYEQTDNYNCGVAAMTNKRTLTYKLLEHKFSGDRLKKKKNFTSRSNKKSSKKKTTKVSFNFNTIDSDDEQERDNTMSLNVSFSDIWKIDMSVRPDQLEAYRIFYHALHIKLSEVYLFYEPIDNTSFVMSEKTKLDASNNQTTLSQITSKYEDLMLKYVILNNPPGTDPDDENCKHVILSIFDTWSKTGYSFGYHTGEFQLYELHATDGVQSPFTPKSNVFSVLPWDYKKFPKYYSYGMWGAIQVGAKVYLMKCAYKNNVSGEIVYGGRLLTTMCVSPRSKALIMDRIMQQMSLIDG